MKTENWKQVKEIFEQAMAVAPERRGNFLDEACSDNEVVRREVEELLDSLDNAESFLETPAIQKKIDEFERGQTLGSYEIVELLGEGGMGRVYLARDKRLKRLVALKVLSADFVANKERLKRFEQEALAVSSLNHPNILTIYEIGHDAGTNFIATEFIEGETLRWYLKHREITFDEILDIAVQAASALAAAHAAGVVHRDIKPENIMVRGDGIVKVLDFGLAKTIRPTGHDAAAPTAPSFQTEEGAILGTVSYMSPEQARSRDIDARSDLWGLGVVLYEMAAGRLPFEGDTTIERLAAILKTEPAPMPSNVPEILQNIILKALRNDKSERYQTTDDLLVDLKDIRRGIGPTGRFMAEARPAPGKAIAERTNEQARETALISGIGYIENHKFVTVLALVIFLFVSSAVGYYFLREKATADPVRAPAPAKLVSLAVLPFENTGNDTEYLSDGITESLIKDLSNLPNLRMISRDGVFNFKNSGQTPGQIGKALGVQSVLSGKVSQKGDSLVLEADLIDVGSNTHLWSRRFDVKSSDILTVQSEIAGQIAEKLQLTLDAREKEQISRHYTENTEAYREYLKGRYYSLQFSLEAHKKALEHLNAAIEIDPVYALAYAGVADAYTTASDTMLPPRETLTKAKAAANKALELDDRLAEAWAARGHARLHEWDRAAIEDLNRAVALAPNSLTTQLWLGEYYMIFDVEKSVQVLEKACELDPLSPIPAAFLSFDYYLLRQNEKAFEYSKKSLDINPRLYIVHAYTARIYANNGDFKAATNELDHVPPEMADGMSISTAGLIFAAQGNRREAEKKIAELQKMAAVRYVSPFEFAIVYAALGDRDRMFSYLDKAYEDRSENLGFARTMPNFDSFRDDPRYSALMRKIGFAE